MRFVDHERRVAAGYSSYNEGLRQYMLKVYNYMAGALGITGLVAFLVSSFPALMAVLFNTPLSWVVMFAPLLYVVLVLPRITHMSLENAQIAFWSFAALMGLSLSSIFIAFTGTSITRVFFITSCMFGGMALYGNTTQRDLTSVGSFLVMGVFGLIIASLVNMFMQSPAIHFATSFLGVIIFAGLTAYDTQKIKDCYYRFNDGSVATASRFAIMGAITLYFDFINIFISMLNLMGERK